MISRQLNLKGFDFHQLKTASGLQELDRSFLHTVSEFNPGLCERLLAYRNNTLVADPPSISQLLIDCSVLLETFIAQLFNIEEAVEELQSKTLSHQPIFAFRSYYVLKQARRALNSDHSQISFLYLDEIVRSQIIAKFPQDDPQLAVAKLGQFYLKNPEIYKAEIDLLIQWCIAALVSEEGQQAVGDWELLRLPKHLDFANLVAVKPVADDVFTRLQGIKERYRDGFTLTDTRMTQRQAMWEIDYCVYCHKNQGDFCSSGFPVKKGDPSQGLKVNPVGETLTGCPLEEKISEMHVLKKSGFSIAALAMVMVDNPMCPMTGHRICNDCMQACIYQKQEPVNIPQTETRILTDVLNLPWGVEIYDLLTTWNPLRNAQWLAKPYNGLKILVMGMGPAGFSLAHHLLMEGFAVVGVDGLKIEPLPEEYITQPIYRYEDIQENLADRIVSGFGGVAEYGITVRWDKNFLKLIYITLMRRPYFQTFGGIRFGGTLTVEDAWALGFDHLALAVGAGLPKELAIPNSLAPGMRQANDFLMALQLTGAAKSSSLTNLQVRLPAIVLGGGLTAVDTATEIQAYYIAQVEKISQRYQILTAHFGEETVKSRFLDDDLLILEEFLTHGRQVAEERAQAQQQQRSPNFIPLIRRWGGVTIAYRRSLQESPAYRRNYEELTKAFEEGIYYAEGLEPLAVLLDPQGQTCALRCQWSIWDEEGERRPSDKEQVLPARSLFVATGARLNVAYEFEHRGTFLRQDRFEYQRFEIVDGQLRQVEHLSHVKDGHFGAFTSYQRDHRYVSFLGDTHPVFHGSVVKAIASAKRVYPQIYQALSQRILNGDDQEYQQFREHNNYLFRVKVESIKRLNSKVLELTVRAPLAARKGGEGQFYRLQNFESLSPLVKNTRLQMEGLALLGVRHPTDADLLSLYVIEQGASTRLVQRLRPGEHISVMGPTGAQCSPLMEPTTILIIGGLYSPPFLLSMAARYRAEGHRILYIGYFDSAADVYMQTELEKIAEIIFWVSKNGKINANRSQDKSFESELQPILQQFPHYPTVQQIWLIGSSCLLQSFQNARGSHLKGVLAEGLPITASVYGPMQCMLKGVCAQCLQWQVDPATGKRSKAVYSCSWQHQPLQKIDIGNIDERLIQNRCQETLTNLWLDYLNTDSSL